MNKLSKDKLEVLKADGNIIVEANAGTGKTKLIEEKFISLITAGFTVDEIVTITFTESAAGELKNRIKTRLYDESKKNKQFKKALLYLPSAQISTIHSFCYEMLKRFGIRYGYFDIDSELISDAEIEEFLEKAIIKVLEEKEFKLLKNIVNKISTDYTEGIRILINFIKESIKHRTRYSIFKKNFSVEFMFEKVKELYSLLNKNEVTLNAKAIENLNREKAIALKLLKLLEESFYMYEKLKKEESKIGYNDLLEITVKMLENEENLREEIAESFRVIIIDEFQDTDPLQWKMVEILKEKTSSPTQIFVVGDPKQSIYRFRSADISIWNMAKEKLGSSFSLTTNFRSGKNILEIFNKTFDILYNKAETPLGMELSFEYFSGESEKGEAVSIPFYKREEFAEKAIALTYQDSLNGQIAIIGRTRKNLEIFENILREKGITFHTIGANPYDTYGVKELLNLLHYIREPENLKALFLFLSSRFCGLNHNQALLFIKEKTTGENELDTIVNSLVEKVESVKKDIDNEPHSILISKLLNITGYMDMLSTVDEESYFSILELTKEISQIEQKKYISFDTLIDEIEKITAARDKTPNKVVGRQNGFFLMTIHGSKGLQFDSVILAPWTNFPKNSRFLYTSIGFGVKLFYTPKLEKETEEEKLENSPFFHMLKKIDSYLDDIEKKNLLYVAMTRAKRKLILGLKKTQKGYTFPYINNTQLSKLFENFIIDVPVINLKIEEKGEKVHTIISREKTETIPVIYPSKIENGEKKNLPRKKIAAPPGIPPEDYGTAVHFLCEAFINGADKKSAIDFATAKFKEKREILEPRLKEIFDYLEKELNILKGAKTEVEVKHFSENKFFSGRADIVLEYEDGVEIWDIKTGFINGNNIENYKKQLYFYKNILENSGQKVKSLKLFFIDERKILEV